MTPCSDDCERVLVLETGREMAASTLLSNPNRHRARITISSSRVRIQNRWRATCSRSQPSNKSKDPDKGKTTTKTLTPVTCSYKTRFSSFSRICRHVVHLPARARREFTFQVRLFYGGATTSINRPDTGCSDFYQVAVRVAKVNALAPNSHVRFSSTTIPFSASQASQLESSEFGIANAT
jgi:hypothetical protein